MSEWDPHPEEIGKLCGGVWLPKDEEHLVEWMTRSKRRQEVDGLLTYQYHKLQACLDVMPIYPDGVRGRTCLDVGAHVGLWSMHLVRHFLITYAFEPFEEHRRLWHANVKPRVPDGHEAYVDPFAVSDRPGTLNWVPGVVSSGDAHIVEGSIPDNAIEVQATSIDAEGYLEVDFIKIDVEGWELNVVRGARETILRDRPVICVEQKDREAIHHGRPAKEALRYLENLGMRVHRELSGDFIMVWS